jgi:P-type Ca2+ transporter type 2C
LPLTAIQILWINLITGGVQDKSFPFAKEEDNVMERPPRKNSNQFFDMVQIWRLLFFGVSMGFVLLELYKHLLVRHDYEESLTICFASLVMTQLMNGIQAQKQRDPFLKNIKKSFTVNPYIFIGVGLGILLQLFAVYGPHEVFHTVRLPLAYWKYPIWVSLIAFAVVETRKWIELFVEYLIKRIKRKKGEPTVFQHK